MTDTTALDALIVDAERALAKAEREAERRRDKVREAITEVKALQEEIKGLELARARKVGARRKPQPEPGSETHEETDIAWNSLGRAAAVRQALIALGKPVAPAQIAAFLTERGREGDSSHYVGAALNYLKTQGLATRVGQGMWLPAEKVEQNTEEERTLLA